MQFNTRGMVAMANAGPDTNKSQFFITYAKQAHLDGRYTIFGKVIDGADSTLDAMERVPISNKNRPLHEIKLTHVSTNQWRRVPDYLYLVIISKRLPSTQTPSLMLRCRVDASVLDKCGIVWHLAFLSLM